MKEALISIIEPCETGYRVAQIVATNETFPIAPQLFWKPCADNVVADQFWYDPSDEQIKPISQPEA